MSDKQNYDLNDGMSHYLSSPLSARTTQLTQPLDHFVKTVYGRVQLKCDGTQQRTGGERNEGETGEWSG
jgi:hypothetical protein